MSEYTPKFKAGDKVRLQYAVADEIRTSELVYEVAGVQMIKGATGSVYVIYTVITPTGQRVSGFLESKLVPVQTTPQVFKPFSGNPDLSPVHVGGRYIEAPATSDELLDAYSDYMSLYAVMHDKEYLELAEYAKSEWHRLYGKDSIDDSK